MVTPRSAPGIPRDVFENLPSAYAFVDPNTHGAVATHSPRVVFIQVTNHCNCLCETCPRTFATYEMPRLLAPLEEGRADWVLSARTRGYIEPGSMPPQQRFDNWLGAHLLRLLYDAHVTDLGPYRAVTRELMTRLDLREMTFGWRIELIAKAARRHARMA